MSVRPCLEMLISEGQRCSHNLEFLEHSQWRRRKSGDFSPDIADLSPAIGRSSAIFRRKSYRFYAKRRFNAGLSPDHRRPLWGAVRRFFGDDQIFFFFFFLNGHILISTPINISSSSSIHHPQTSFTQIFNLFSLHLY